MSRTRRKRNGFAVYGWVSLVLFMAVVAFLGGSSRPDAVQIAALRPLACLFLIPVLYFLDFGQLRPVRGPLILIGLLGVWMAVQLIPLPPTLWQSLPGMDPVTAVSIELGLQDDWRPISFVPSRTLNALASLIVPVVAMLLPIAFGFRRSTLLLAVIALGTLSAMLGILQILGGNDSALYLYEFVNRGSPTGLLANRNHAAILLSLSLLSIAYVFASPGRRALPVWQKLGLASAFLIVLVTALISGSRAGFVTALIALSASGILLLIKSGMKAGEATASKRASTSLPNAVKWPIMAAVAVLLLVALFAAFGRLPALDRLFSSGPLEDLRFAILPVLIEMMQTHFLAGTGFGSFEEVYHIYEPTGLLMPEYLNMAHNDWAQYVIEGGIPGVAILLAFFVWFGRAIWQLRDESSPAAKGIIYWVATILIISLASVADYALRAPLVQVAVIWLLVAFCLERPVADE